MMSDPKYIHYSQLASIFSYPTDELPLHTRQCQEWLLKDYPNMSEAFSLFSNWVSSTSLNEMEEVYTKTFHIQAICYLDLGFVLFGEDYKRGEFLVNMKREQELAGNDCGDELPDNLSNVLTLFPKLKDKEIRDELAVRILIPALKKMLFEFNVSRMEMRNKAMKKKHNAILLENQANGNIYQYALSTLLGIISKDFENIKYELPEKQNVMNNDFLNTSCQSCTPNYNKSIKTVKI